jgi:RNA polymerase sigma factor (sigma-70 family)
MEPDNNLAENVKNDNCEESLKILISKHTPLCYNILQKFYPLLSKAGFTKDDVFNDKDYLIYKSAKTFKSNKKTKYSTWLGNYTRYHCLNMLNSKKCNLISIEEDGIRNLVERQPELQDPNRLKNTREFVAHILSELKDKRVKKIYMMRDFSGEKKTWKEIAAEIGVSSQTVINIHNKSKKFLKNKLKSRNVFDFV